MNIDLAQHKETIIAFFDMFALYEIAFAGVCFIIFLLFFMLGMLLRGRKFLPKIFFFLSAVVFMSGPVGFQYFMDEFLYKLDVQVLEGRKLEYIDSFLLRAKVKHEGFLSSRICTAAVDIPRDGALAILNPIFPLKTYRHQFEMPLAPGEEDEIYAIFNDFEVKDWSSYIAQVRCRNENGIAKIGKHTGKKTNAQNEENQAEDVLDSESSDSEKSQTQEQETQNLQNPPQTNEQDLQNEQREEQ